MPIFSSFSSVLFSGLHKQLIAFIYSPKLSILHVWFQYDCNKSQVGQKITEKKLFCESCSCMIQFFPCSAFLWDFSISQDRLSGDASKLGSALLCSSRAGSVYVAVSRNSIVHRDWGSIIVLLTRPY